MDNLTCDCPPVNPDAREPYTRADLDWAAQAFNAEPTDAEWDTLAGEAEALDRLCMGLCP
jgi:hypothetical protein